MRERGNRNDWLVIRCANEGLSIPAIARITLIRTTEVEATLRCAIEDGLLREMPARYDVPTAPAAINRVGIDARVPAIMVHMGLPPAQATMVAAILEGNGFVSDNVMFAATGGAHIHKRKTNDVRLHYLRKRLEPFGVEIEKLWGVGYRMSEDSLAKVRALLRTGKVAA